MDRSVVLNVTREAVTPPASDRWRVKEDQRTRYQLDDANEYGVRLASPNPAVFRTGFINDPKSYQRTPFTREYQFMAADLLALSKFGVTFGFLTGANKDYIIRAFNGVYKGTDPGRFITNGQGVDTCHNYLNGENADQPDPKIDPFICAGSIVQVLEIRTYNGLQMARLNSFRAPAVASLSDSRVLKATIISRTGALSNFPQLEGAPVYYPYISSHDVWYNLDDLEAI